jgi:Tol biopolymer transport system component
LIASRNHRETGIYIGNLAIGGKTFTPHRFTTDGWSNEVDAWTKDSKAILFSSTRNGRWAIFKQGVDANKPQTLIAGIEHYWSPKLSAGGILLYSASAAPDESNDTTTRLMSTPEQGGARSTLMLGSYGYACGSSPSSSCVAAELKDQQLIFYDLDPLKGRGGEIARLDGYKALEPRFSLSPDSSRLAIVDPPEPGGEIRILNLADRKVTVLSVRDWKWQYLQHISWAANGTSLFALAPSGPSWDILSIDANGKPGVLYEVPAGAGWVSSIVPSPDGRSLAFTKRTFVNDIMLLENF